MISRREAVDTKLNQIGRQAILRLLEAHIDNLTEVINTLGPWLQEPDWAGLDDYLTASQRLTKTLGASSLD